MDSRAVAGRTRAPARDSRAGVRAAYSMPGNGSGASGAGRRARLQPGGRALAETAAGHGGGATPAPYGPAPAGPVESGRPQPCGRSVQTMFISPVTAPSSRVMRTSTGNSGLPPASSSPSTSAAGLPSSAVAVTGPMASFL